MTQVGLHELDHRPWPPPERRWSWRQRWCDVLFAHWPVPVRDLRPLVPEPLEVEQFDGTAWVGLLPFRMEGAMRRPFPGLPWISAFLELAVRTYVTLDGRPGVWFLSLDANKRLAIQAARLLFHLPYYRARMSISRCGDAVVHRSARRGVFGSNCDCRFRPTGPVYEAAPESLDRWLTARYCLYARARSGELHRAEVHHAPWPLQPAEAELRESMLKPLGLAVEGDPMLHFARRLDVVVWSPERVR